MGKVKEAGGEGHHSNEGWAQDTYGRADFEDMADKLEAISKRRHLPTHLRKEMFAVAWDMKQYARRGTASFGV